MASFMALEVPKSTTAERTESATCDSFRSNVARLWSSRIVAAPGYCIVPESSRSSSSHAKHHVTNYQTNFYWLLRQQA